MFLQWELWSAAKGTLGHIVCGKVSSLKPHNPGLIVFPSQCGCLGYMRAQGETPYNAEHGKRE